MTWWLKTLRNMLYSYVSAACYCTRNLKQCLKFLLIIFGTRTITSLGKCLVRCSDVAASPHHHFWWHIWVKNAFLNTFSSGKRWGLGEVGILTGDGERTTGTCRWRTGRLRSARASFLLLKQNHGLMEYRVGLCIFVFTVILVGRYVFVVAPGL